MEGVAGERGEGEGPLFEAGETVRRLLVSADAVAKPRKADGDAAADRFAGREGGCGREEERVRLAGGLPVREVRAVQVDGGGAGGQGDLRAGEAVVLVEGEDARQGEGLVELGG